MDHSFYQQIEDEEASRLAKKVATEEELKAIAESTRFQFYFGEGKKEIAVRSAVFFSLLMFVVIYLEDSFLLSLVIITLVLELYWNQERLTATTKLFLLHVEGESSSEEIAQ
ncbi:MAG: hypothetical protein ACSHYB_16275 [Roseibacillus sp.]